MNFKKVNVNLSSFLHFVPHLKYNIPKSDFILTVWIVDGLDLNLEALARGGDLVRDQRGILTGHKNLNRLF